MEYLRGLKTNMNEHTNNYLTIAQSGRALEWAGEMNRRREEAKKEINRDADAIQSSTMLDELAKKNEKISELEGQI